MSIGFVGMSVVLLSGDVLVEYVVKHVVFPVGYFLEINQFDVDRLTYLLHLSLT